MHACQSAIARSFPYKIHAMSCMKLPNRPKGILHKECAAFTIGLKNRHSKYYTMYYMTINKNSTKHTHLLDKTSFKGMLPGLKTTKLL